MHNKQYQQNIDPSWRKESLCQNMDTDDFFPIKVNKHNIEKVQSIVSLCDSCTVKYDCFYESVTQEYHGIWAGTFHKDRMRWIKNLNKPAKEVSFTECYEYLEANSNRRILPRTGNVDVEVC